MCSAMVVTVSWVMPSSAPADNGGVMTLARDLGFEPVFGSLSRSDLYVADEMFVCGTAAEVSSVRSVDDRELPCPGEQTLAIGHEYHKVVRGEIDRYKDWVELAR